MSMDLQSPLRDYTYIDDNPDVPIMESTLHSRCGQLLCGAIESALHGTNDLVTGNVLYNPGENLSRVAPDVMVIPGLRGREFRSYAPQEGDPVPSVCIEVRSKSNTDAVINRRARHLLSLGVAEFYVLEPENERFLRATLNGDHLAFHDAVGVFSTAMNMMIGRQVDGTLFMCCPGGQAVTFGDNPYEIARGVRDRLMVEMMQGQEESRRADDESRRADEESRRADEEARRADRNAEALADALAELERLRSLG